MKRVLFLCTGNSARSQMSEALLRDLGAGNYEVKSAGTAIAPEVNPFAIEALKLRNIPIDGLYPKTVDEFVDEHFDVVVTVCDNAKQTCPFFPNAKEFLHWSLDDPAAHQGSYEEILFVFQETRDEIERRIREEFSLS